MRATLAFTLVAVAVMLRSDPVAAITQPNGTVIPVTSQLQDIFTARGETINALSDAAILPERYLPGCTLTFTMVSRGMATFQDAFGWYNARTPAARPDPSDLHVFIPCSASAGDIFTLDMRDEPAYEGGEIGFFLITPEGLSSQCASLSNYAHTYFSEREFNDDAMGASSYIHLLTYDSTATPAAFYFCWEDLFGGGDNNFTDFVALVQNLTCSGGGATCSTGMMGVCAAGTQQCHDGTLACQQTVAPSPEVCDGLDNDCNGVVDDGTGLCPGTQICDEGVCVAPCLSELGCFTPLVCTSRGTCVEPDCATVTCPSGERCVGGTCVMACTGIVCPEGQVCRVGRCVDPCSGVMCDSDQVCVAGVCQPLCQCRPCASTQTCGTDGICRPTDCASVTCGMGQYCSIGSCMDACAGAVCPEGQMCTLGNCVTPPVVDGGMSQTDSGMVLLSDVGVITMGMDASVDVAEESAGDATGTMDQGTAFVARKPSGCSCRAGREGEGGQPSGVGIFFAAAAVFARRRRLRASV